METKFTPCKTRTNSYLIVGGRHGVIRMEMTTPIVQTEKCPVTGKTNCKSRKCELHYMDAPLKLAPNGGK